MTASGARMQSRQGYGAEHEVRRISFSTLELDPAFGRLVAEYGEECQIRGLPPVRPQPDIYRLLDASGVMETFGAYIGAEMVGFLILLLSVAPHYGETLAMTESLYLRPEFRSTGIGGDLLELVERRAAERGAIGILVSAPLGGRLAEVLPTRGYVKTNEIFFCAVRQ